MLVSCVFCRSVATYQHMAVVSFAGNELFLRQYGSDNRPVAQFNWNNGNHTVNETNTYSLDNDPSNLSTLDFELNTYGTLTIEAYIDDQGWPTPSNEHSLGSETTTFDPRVLQRSDRSWSGLRKQTTATQAT